MMKYFLSFFLIFVVAFGYAQVTVVNLLCENRHEPFGIDAKSPRLSWQLQSSKRNVMQSAYELQVSNDASFRSVVWSTGKVSSAQSVQVGYAGDPLKSAVTYYWKVRVWDHAGNNSGWSKVSTWKMGLMSAGDWKAKWIGPAEEEDTINRPSPIFRKQISMVKKPVHATAFITSHGMYEAYINGQKIGNEYLTPGWTSYNKRLQYQAYDVSNMLKGGDNVIAAMLGSGWYRGLIGFEGHHNAYGSDIALLMQINIDYSDGTHEIIGTDDSWKYSTGEVRYAEIYNGETIDARKEQAGWTNTGFNDQSWASAKEFDYPMNVLIATENDGVKKHETFKPVRIFKTPAGETVVDFGQNLVGWAELRVNGKAGDSITLSHAEVLDKDGNFYTLNLRSARAVNTYVLRGNGEERFTPHFTWQGFRYVKVEGFPGELKPENISAVALYSDMQPTGTFTSSNSMLNQLQHNIQWGQKGNFLDVPTDCPQRDERLGWTGDAQVFSRTAAYNMNVNSFFTKWLKDVAADQTNEGSIPFVIPNVIGATANGAAGWADVCTIIPWNMYTIYGDSQILRNQYASMKGWVDFMDKTSVNGLWTRGNVFGDWLFYRPFDDNDGRSAVTDKSMISQSFFAHSTQLLINAAKVLGKEEDVKKYADLQEKVKQTYLREFLTPAGRLVSGTQTAYVLALQFDLLPENLRKQAVERLVQNVKDYDYHLTTGFLGTPYLCDVLTKYGYVDIAYKLLLQDTYPSWLYPVKMGATTIWERWDGQKPDSSFQTPGMNSFNHYAYGAIGDWMYTTIAGLNGDEQAPGYRKIVIKPVIGGGLTSADATLDTYYGKLRSSWNISQGQLKMHVDIPANTTATIYIPAANADAIVESGKPLISNKSFDVGPTENNYVRLRVGSGAYDFTVKQ